YDLETGKTLQIQVKEMTMPGGKYNAVTCIDFLPRRHKYPRDILKGAPNLDAVPIRLTYQELQSILLGESSTHAPEPASNGQDPTASSTTESSDPTADWTTPTEPAVEEWVPK